jgi:hypothetical protein
MKYINLLGIAGQKKPTTNQITIKGKPWQATI